MTETGPHVGEILIEVPNGEDRESVLRLVEGVGLSFDLQPIRHLGSGRAVGFEALPRFDAQPYRSSDLWFAAADAAGYGVALELAALRAARDRFALVPQDAYLSINVSLRVALDPRFAEVLAEAPLDRLVVELAEQSVVDDYNGLDDALRGLRARGLRVAVDDAGAGFASLLHVLKLSPDVVKIGAALIIGVARDPHRRALVASLVEFTRFVAATVVAEGVETADDAAVLRKLGVTCGQGCHLGAPQAHVPEMQVTARQRAVLARGARTARRVRSRALRLRPAVVLLVMACLIGPTLFTAAAHASPGNPLWGLKLRLEGIQLILETNPARKAGLHIEFAQRRMEELSALPMGSRLTRAVLQSLDGHVEAALAEVARISRTSEDRIKLRRQIAGMRPNLTALQTRETSLCRDASHSSRACEAVRMALDETTHLLAVVETPGVPHVAHSVAPGGTSKGAHPRRTAPAGHESSAPGRGAGAHQATATGGQGAPTATSPVLTTPSLPLPVPSVGVMVP